MRFSSSGEEHSSCVSEVTFEGDEDSPLYEAEVVRTKGSVSGAVFNLANTTLGAGALGLPYVFKSSGIVLGVVLLLFFSVISDYSLSLLHTTAVTVSRKRSDMKDYEDIGRYLHGRTGAYSVILCVVLTNFGACVSYMIIIGDLLVETLEHWAGDDSYYSQILLSRPVVVGFVTVLFLWPLSATDKIGSLRFTSLVSLVALMIFIGTVVVYYFVGETESKGNVKWASVDISMFQVLSVITFAFACQTSLLPITSEFNKPQRVGKSIHIAVAVCFATYLVVACFGYLSFFENTKGDVILSYPEKNVVIDVVKIVLAAAIILTFPMASYPCRLSLDNLMFPDKQKCWRPLRPLITYPYLRVIAIATTLVSLAFILSIAFPSITVVFGLVGATSATCTSYLFPAWFYIRVIDWNQTAKWKRIPAVFMILFGFIFGALSTVVIVVGLFIDIE